MGPLNTAMLRTSKASFSSSEASSPGPPNASRITRHAGNRENGLPVVDMMMASDATRCGSVPARIWAIIPPIEAPTTCARGDTEVIEQRDHVAGHVDQRVGHRAAAAQQIAP